MDISIKSENVYLNICFYSNQSPTFIQKFYGFPPNVLFLISECLSLSSCLLICDRSWSSFVIRSIDTFEGQWLNILILSMFRVKFNLSSVLSWSHRFMCYGRKFYRTGVSLLHKLEGCMVSFTGDAKMKSNDRQFSPL